MSCSARRVCALQSSSLVSTFVMRWRCIIVLGCCFSATIIVQTRVAQYVVAIKIIL